MDIVRKRKVLKAIQALEKDIETLKGVRTKLATSEYASASLSSGGGSKSYTRQSLGQLSETIRQLARELQLFRNMLATDSPTGFRPSTVLHIYGW